MKEPPSVSVGGGVGGSNKKINKPCKKGRRSSRSPYPIFGVCVSTRVAQGDEDAGGRREGMDDEGLQDEGFKRRMRVRWGGWEDLRLRCRLTAPQSLTHDPARSIAGHPPPENIAESSATDK